jgi:N-acetylglucosaminyl-diphospho-decaprenol L-rhamnosyltransferase
LSHLAVVVVSYNTQELTRKCLESVGASLDRSGLEADVCVVDNASSDGSADMVRARFPEVRLIANQENLGFARANNVGLRALGLDGKDQQSADTSELRVLLLNPDTEVQGEAIGTLCRFMDSQPGTGLAGASLLHPDGRFQHSAFHFPSLAQAFLDFFPIHHRLLDSRLNGRYPRSRYEGGRPFPIDHPLGAAMMVRGEAIQQVGLLDEGFFMYCEEIDWCMRMKAGGWDIHCVPSARIVHHVAQSTRQFRDRMFVELWRSRFRLFEKHYGPAYRWVVRRIVRLGLWWAARNLRSDSVDAEEREARLGAYAEVLAM